VSALGLADGKDIPPTKNSYSAILEYFLWGDLWGTRFDKKYTGIMGHRTVAVAVVGFFFTARRYA